MAAVRNQWIWRRLIIPLCARLARRQAGGVGDGAIAISEALKAPRHVLVVPDARAGGIFLAASHIWAIRNHYPHTEITTLVRADRDYVAREIPFIDRRVVYDEFVLPFGARVGTVIDQLRQNLPDIAFCFSSEESVCAPFFCCRSGARLRIGFQRQETDYFNIQIVPRPDSAYEPDRLALIPRILGIPEVEERVSWAVSKEGTRRIQDRFLVGREQNERFVALDVSTSSGSRPSLRQFQVMARTMASLDNVRLLLFFDYESRREANQIADHIREAVGPKILPIQGDDLPRVVALLDACELLVAANTDLFHLSITTDRPVVGILPDDEISRWAPPGAHGPEAHRMEGTPEESGDAGGHAWVYGVSRARDWGPEAFRRVLESACPTLTERTVGAAAL